MKIVVMGTGPFAVPTCRRLLESSHQICAVVTRPLVTPAPKKLPPRPVFEWASEAGLQIFEPTRINDPQSVELLKRFEADLFFVCDYGQILSNACLESAKLGGINLHGSLLPRHRGAAPVQWTILRGDSEAGVCVIHMTPRLDGGPILSMLTTEIATDENAMELEQRLAELGAAASMNAIDQLAGWDHESELGSAQDPDQVTKAPRFSKRDGQLDFRLRAGYLSRLVRACQPWPGTFAELERPGAKSRMRIMVRSARSVDSCKVQQDEPGSVYATTAEELGLDWEEPWSRLLAVHCGSGSVLLIRRLQPAGKREMEAVEFLRGHEIKPGTRFILPEQVCSELS